MPTNSDVPKHGGSEELEKRFTAVEGRLDVIGKTLVTAEVLEREIGALRDEVHVGLAAVRHEMQVGFAALRVEIAKVPFELVKWLIALAGIAAAIATTVYNI